MVVVKGLLLIELLKSLNAREVNALESEKQFFDEVMRGGEAGIARMVSERTQESLVLDFKTIDGDAAPLTKDGRKTLAEVISGFANSDGGIVVWGEAWLHKLRRCMVVPDRQRLKGEIEVDETYCGGLADGPARGRSVLRKTLVACAVEKDGRACGRVRLAVVNNASFSNLKPFTERSVLSGSTLNTDGWGGYNGIEKCGYTRVKDSIKGSKDKAHVTFPRVHSVFSLMSVGFCPRTRALYSASTCRPILMSLHFASIGEMQKVCPNHSNASWKALCASSAIRTGKLSEDHRAM